MQLYPYRVHIIVKFWWQKVEYIKLFSKDFDMPPGVSRMQDKDGDNQPLQINFDNIAPRWNVHEQRFEVCGDVRYWESPPEIVTETLTKGGWQNVTA